MSEQIVHAVARRTAGAHSRRGSLLALGGAALAALPASARAGKGNKAGKKVKRVCRRQGAECRALVIELCEGDQECLDEQLPCCAFFARCKAGLGFACFEEDDEQPV